MGIGCTVPSADQVNLERLCAGRGLQTIDGVLRADPDACDRGLDLTIRPQGFTPGCIRVAVKAADGRTLPPLELRPPPNGGQGSTLHVAVLLSDAWSDDLRIQADAFEQTCDMAAVTSDAFTTSQPNKWQLRQSPLELIATDADRDGFVSSDTGGTDCNDSDASISGPRHWYVDSDGDSYGNRVIPPVGPSCAAPTPSSSSRSGDCNDQDPSVHPDQPEFRCDGKDDNCDDVTDEVFDLGADCANEFQCPGFKTCDLNLGVQCVSTVTPTAWYMDEDGDGKAGTDAGVSCSRPTPGATAEMMDCDESSPFAAKGIADICDRLDNNCDGVVDEGSCNYLWQSTNVSTPNWVAIATYGDSRAWFVSTTGQMVHVDMAGRSPVYTECQGSWNAAWSSQTGQLFIAGRDGKLATRTRSFGSCIATQTPDPTAQLTGIVGVENLEGGVPTTYAVASNGYIFEWTPPSAPVQTATTGINLRAITARGGIDTLLVVGAKDFGVAEPIPKAFHYSPSQDQWIEETLPASAPSVYLTAAHVLSRRFAYAAGNKGVIFEREDGVWRQLPSLTSRADITGIVAFSRKLIYVSTAQGTIERFDQSQWTRDYQASPAVRAISGTKPTHLVAAGDQGVVLEWRP